ncbi:MAG: DUF3829 domain-containing protein [Polyangiales bacterium]
MPENPNWPGAPGPQGPNNPNDPYGATVATGPAGQYGASPSGVAPTMAVPAMAMPPGVAPFGSQPGGAPGGFGSQPGGASGGFGSQPGGSTAPFGSMPSGAQPPFASQQGGFPGSQPGFPPQGSFQGGPQGFPPQGSFQGGPQGFPPQGGFQGGPQGFGMPPQQMGYSPGYRPPTSSGSGAMVGAGVAIAALVGLGVVGAVVKRGARRAVSTVVARNNTNPLVTTPSRLNAINDPIEQTASKLDPYIEQCLNRFSRQVFSAQDRYRQWCNENVGPTGRERNVYGIYQVTGETSRCAQAVQRAATMSPSFPAIESAGNAYVVALNNVVPLINQTYTYYSRQNYRDDDFAQGRQLHGPLIVALRQFTAAHRGLSDSVNEVQDRNNDLLLARIQNDPTRRLEYLVKLSLRTGKRLMRIGREGRVERTGTITMAAGQDAAFIQLATEYEQNIDALQSYVSLHPEATTRTHMISSYLREGNSYLLSVKNMARRLRDQEAFTSSERFRIFGGTFGRYVQGTPENVLDRYNSLVRTYNYLRF